MPDPKAKKEGKYDNLVAALRSLEAQKAAQMAALSAAPGAHVYAPLVQAMRQPPPRVEEMKAAIRNGAQFAPQSAQEADMYGKMWSDFHAYKARGDLDRQPMGPQADQYLQELKRRNAITPQTETNPAAPAPAPTADMPKVPYKLAPEMVVTAIPQVDANVDASRGNPIQYLPTGEYPGQSGVYMDRAADAVYEPVPKNPDEKQQLIEDELRTRKWNRRLLPEFQTPESRITYKL